MGVKVYAYLENMKKLSEDEIFNLLPDQEFDKNLTTNISERIKQSSQVWAKTLSSLPIGKGLLAHKKDVLIRDDLQEYLKIMNNYDGVLFIDFNKVTDDISKVLEFIHSCDESDSIGTLRFDDKCNLDQFIINHHRSLQEMCNAFIYVPNTRVEEFAKMFTLSLKSSAMYVCNNFHDDKDHMTMMCLGYKLNKYDSSTTREELENSVAFYEFCREEGIDYGVLQKVGYNRLLGQPKTFKNVKTLTMGSVYAMDNGSTVKLQGNKHIRFLRNGLGKCNPWHYKLSECHNVSKTEFQKNFKHLKESIKDLEELKENIGKEFISNLESEINAN